MARLGKRQARRQISKDHPVDDNSSDESASGSDNEQQSQAIPVAQRVMAKPVSRSSKQQSSENPFKGLSFPTMASVATTATKADTKPSELNDKQKEAVLNIKALNKCFLTAVQKSVDKDEYIDFSSLFPQYTKHRAALDQRFEYAKELSSNGGKKMELGFEEIRPVSVDLPAFAVKPPPTILPDQSLSKSAPKVTTDTMPSPQSQPTKPAAFSFPSTTPLPAFGTSSGSTPALFSFGSTPAFTFPTPAKQEQSDDDDDAIPAGEEESFSSVRTNAELLKRGEGEEDEEELQPSLRCKLFIYDSSSSAWTDLGIGFVKVNRRSDSPKARILCRAEGSGRILLNAFLDPHVSTSSHEPGKRDVQLTVFNQDSRLAKYLIRAKEVEQAASLYSVLTKCIN